MARKPTNYACMFSQAVGVPVLCGFVKLWSREGTGGKDVMMTSSDDNLQGGPNDHIAIAGISPIFNRKCIDSIRVN